MKIIRTGALVAAMATTTIALCQARSIEPVQFDIEGQNLGAALQMFSVQAHVQVLRRDEDVALNGISAPAVTGTLSAEQALDQLLAGSGFTYEFINERTVKISSQAEKAKETSDPSVSPRPTRPRPQTDGGAAAQKTATDATAAEKIEEVVVTAQKREERLQNVPISISVMSGETLDQSTGTGLTEALRNVPGVATTVHHQGGGTQVSVRGVAANGVLFRGSSPVSYYLDAIPFGFVKSAAAPDANVYDLARVEVLRGPQGTLYGAGAQNGVVRILTQDADLSAFEFKGRTSGSSTDHGAASYRADAALNVPIIEGKLAARLVGGYEELGGWIDKPNDRDANDGQLSNLRLKVNAQPTEAFSIGLSAWASRTDRGAQDASADGRTHFSSIHEPITTDYDVYGLRMGYNFSTLAVTSVTSYLDYENRALEDLAQEGFEGEVITNQWSHVFAQEINVSSTQSSSWRWSGGAFYRDATDRLRPDILVGYSGTTFPFADDSNTSQSFALFGELTKLMLAGKLELTGGLRYFEDRVTQRENLPYDGDLSRALIHTERTFHKVSPRAVVTWHPDDRSTVYASYSEGFRSGFNQDASIVGRFPTFPAVKPDNLKNYEIGSKGRLFDGHIAYDAAVYYLDWKDVQLVRSILIDGLLSAAPLNGDSASGMGVDFTVTLLPVKGLELSLSMGWNDLTSDSQVISSGAVLFAKGDRLNYSPEITSAVSLDYVFPLGGRGFEGRFSTSATYMSEQTFHNVEGGVSVNYPGDPLLVARTAFAVRAPKNWIATVYIDNLTNENGAMVGGLFGDRDNAPHLRPRTAGVQFEYRF